MTEDKLFKLLMETPEDMWGQFVIRDDDDKVVSTEDFLKEYRARPCGLRIDPKLLADQI